MSDNIFICKICNHSYKSLGCHIKFSHKISVKEYFDSYIDPEDHKCPFCDNERKFGGIAHGYFGTCGSNLCTRRLVQATIIKKYGYDKRKESREKTCLAKFGVKSYAKLEEQHEKAWNTIKENGDVQRIIEKGKSTRLERYGVEFMAQSAHCRKRPSKHIYNGISFFSKNEIAIYKFCETHNLKCRYEPYDRKIEYVDALGTKHFYFPDFEIEGKLYEFKGPQFFTKDGKYRTPWKKGLNEDEIAKVDVRDDAKYNCMIDNNVTIITDSSEENLNKVFYGQHL